MGSGKTAKQGKSGPRVRRSTRPRGKARAADILQAAAEILIQSGYAQLTMRSVAEIAGVRLSHLQYYFPTKRDLVRGLTEHIALNSGRRFEKVIATVPDTPTARFMAWIDFLIDDCWALRRRRHLIQLWGLLESEDGPGSEVLCTFYGNDVRETLKLLRDLSPHMKDPMLIQRATIIAGLIEGVMLFVESCPGDLEIKSLKAETRRQIFKIATEL